VGVGRRTEFGRAGAENLGAGLELGVHLETDDGFKFHSLFHQLSEITFNYEMRGIRESA
jgi:hypothetical protein